nr:putative ribonuclease H-like domain-containing protein [Tanacetum cinerariifolium]
KDSILQAGNPVKEILLKLNEPDHRILKDRGEDKNFVEYIGIEVKHFRDTLLQHISNVKKSVAERTRHQRQYDRRLNKKQMQTQKSKIDTGKAVDVEPIFDKEPVADVQLTAECNIFAIGQQHTEQPEIINKAKIKKEIDVLETINIELEHSVAKLPKENKTLKKHYKDLYDSIKITRSKTIEQTTSLLANNADLKAQIQEKVFVIDALKNDLRKLKRNSIDTKFAKTSVLGKPVLQSLRNQSVVRQQNAFKSERPQISKPRFSSQVDVNKNLSRPVTQHYFSKKREFAFSKPDHMIASSSFRNSSKNMPRFSSNDMVHNYYPEEARKKTQERNRNLKSSVMHTASPQNSTKGSKPKPRSNNQTSKSLPVSKSSCVMITVMPKVDHSNNSSSFLDSKHFVCSTCHKCVFSANHDACITKLLKEVNSRAMIQSHKTRNSNKPVDQKSHTQKHGKEIFRGHKFSPNKTSAVYEKTSPRSDLSNKPVDQKSHTQKHGKEIFRGHKFSPNKTSAVYEKTSPRSDLSKPTHGSNADITNIHESKQTLDLSAGTSINIQKEQSFDLSAELESLSGPFFDEYFPGENQVVSKSSVVTTADASIKRQQQQDSTSSTSTLPITVTADGNFDLYQKSSCIDTSQLLDDPNMPELEDITYYDDKDVVGAEVDFNNLETSITVSPIPTTRVHKDHPVTQIIGDLSSATQTRSMTRVAKDQGGLFQINNDDFHTCMFACFLSQEEPKRVHQPLKDPSWIEDMQEELLQFKMQKVWVLVDLAYGKRAIGTKWVFRNKKNERGIVVGNKARLVAQGHTQEKEIDYEEVFAPVARIEAIRLFLAYAFFMGFMVYQMDVKSAFLYETIEEEVYVCQPLGFEDPDYHDKVYKVVKALYGLHQAPRAWLTDGKSASIPIDTEKLLLNDPDVKRIFRYLKSKPHLGLWYPKDSPFDLVAYSDSDYVGASLDRKSPTGGCQFLRCRLISWQCKKQTVVATSSTKVVLSGMESLKRMLHVTNILSAGSLTTQKMVYNLPCLTHIKNWLVQIKRSLSWLVQKQTALGQMTTGEEISNPFMAGSLPKTMLLNFIHTTVDVKKVNDVTRLQALVDKKKVIITEATIRDALRLDDAEGVECLPNEKIFTELARMGYEKPSTKLTFYKAFFSSQWKFLIHTILQCMSAKRMAWNEFSSSMASVVICLSSGKGFSRVDTPLFKGMLVVQEVGKGDADEVNVEDVNAAGVATEGVVSAADDVVPTADEEPSIPSPTSLTPPTQSSHDIPSTSQIAQAQEINNLNQRFKKLEIRNKLNVLKLRRLKRVGSAQRIDTSDDTVMDDIDLEHVNKVLSMQDDEESEPAELQEVVNVVTTAKIITKVVSAASDTIPAASITITAADVPIPAATTAVAPTLTVAPSRRRKGVVIRDPKETTTTSTIIHSEAKSKDKGKGILVEEPKPFKKKDQIKQDEAYTRELEAELNKNINWDEVIDHLQRKQKEDKTMDYFKGMTYDDIRPVFEKYFDSNMAFLQKTKEHMDEEDSRALKRMNESQKEKAAKKQKLDEEVEELKRHLQIVPNDEDDIYTEATPLSLKVPVVDYEIYNKNNKPYYKIKRAYGSHQLYLSFPSLFRTFDREDLEALWILVKERFATIKPNNFSDDFLLITLGAMFKKPDIHAKI